MADIGALVDAIAQGLKAARAKADAEEAARQKDIADNAEAQANAAKLRPKQSAESAYYTDKEATAAFQAEPMTAGGDNQTPEQMKDRYERQKQALAQTKAIRLGTPKK